MANRSAWLPDEWTDDERMGHLMAMFRRRDLNPTDWDSKVEFWERLITEYCSCERNPVFSIKDLKYAFKRKNNLPAGLVTVVNEMRSKGTAQALDECLSKGEGWVSWGFNAVVKTPLTWIWGSSTPDDAIESVLFVCNPAVEKIANSILTRHSESLADDPISNTLLEWGTLQTRVRDLCPSSRTFDLAIRHLEKTGSATVNYDQGERVVKFKDASSGSKRVTITSTDTDIHRLQKSLTQMESELTSLRNTINQIKQRALAAKRAGDKNQALKYMRELKIREKQFQAKQTGWENLLTMRTRLAETKDQKQVLDAYSASASAYKGILREHGLSPERVDQAMDDMHEALSDHEEISEAISRPIPSWIGFGGSLDVTDDDLEAELRALVGEEELEQPHLSLPKRPVVPLPDIPSQEIPTKSKKKEDRLVALRRQLLEGAD